MKICEAALYQLFFRNNMKLVIPYIYILLLFTLFTGIIEEVFRSTNLYNVEVICDSPFVRFNNKRNLLNGSKQPTGKHCWVIVL